MAKQTDNHNPKVKLDLRRYFLRKYHSHEPPRVLDCCQGGGLMWGALRKEFPVASYWGLDLKPKKGRLKLDSVRVLAQPGWNQNVIDIDTYGSPWKHWLALLPNVQLPVTVFLTLATIAVGGGGNITNEEKQQIGLDKLPSCPQTFYKRIGGISTQLLLSKGLAFATIGEAIEAVSDGNARYIGVRLEKRPAGATTPTGQHTHSVKGNEHV